MMLERVKLNLYTLCPVAAVRDVAGNACHRKLVLHASRDVGSGILVDWEGGILNRKGRVIGNCAVAWVTALMRCLHGCRYSAGKLLIKFWHNAVFHYVLLNSTNWQSVDVGNHLIVVRLVFFRLRANKSSAVKVQANSDLSPLFYVGVCCQFIDAQKFIDNILWEVLDFHCLFTAQNSSIEL